MKRPRTIEFSPRQRGNIIRAVAQDGAYQGSRYDVAFAIFRAMEGVFLLVREGKRWRKFDAPTVWEALGMVQKRSLYAGINEASAPSGSTDGGVGPDSMEVQTRAEGGLQAIAAVPAV